MQDEVKVINLGQEVISVEVTKAPGMGGRQAH